MPDGIGGVPGGGGAPDVGLGENAYAEIDALSYIAQATSRHGIQHTVQALQELDPNLISPSLQARINDLFQGQLGIQPIFPGVVGRNVNLLI